jgi:hypothetical protein
MSHMKALDDLRRQILNDRLNASEERLCDRIGRRAVTRLVTAFKAEAAENPKLWEQLYRQSSPYAWIHQRAKRRLARTPISQPGQTAGP